MRFLFLVQIALAGLLIFIGYNLDKITKPNSENTQQKIYNVNKKLHINDLYISANTGNSIKNIKAKKSNHNQRQ